MNKKWLTNEKKISLLLKQSIKYFVVKPPDFRNTSEMQNDALMHREGVTLTARG